MGKVACLMEALMSIVKLGIIAYAHAYRTLLLTSSSNTEAFDFKLDRIEAILFSLTSFRNIDTISSLILMSNSGVDNCFTNLSAICPKKLLKSFAIVCRSVCLSPLWLIISLTSLLLPFDPFNLFKNFLRSYEFSWRNNGCHTILKNEETHF